MPELKWARETFSAHPSVHDPWKNWVRAADHSSQELLDIVYGRFQEEYQKRAMFLLLVPDTRLAPFGWNHREPFHFLHQEVDFRKVEVGLRSHAVYWLTKFIDYARYSVTDKDSKSFLLNTYNQYILQLLEVLPPEDNQAETIFQYFSIDDPAVSPIVINGSGYNPLLALWKNSKINERWKRLAEIEIRQIIQRELRGESTPLKWWENALPCYAHHLQSLLCPPSQSSALQQRAFG